MLAFFRLLLVAALSVGSILPEPQSVQLHASPYDSPQHAPAGNQDEWSAEPSARLLSLALGDSSGEACTATFGRNKRLGGSTVAPVRLAVDPQPIMGSARRLSSAACSAPRSLVSQRIRLQI